LLFDTAKSQGWELQTSSYVLSEVIINLRRLPTAATQQWNSLHASLTLVPDVVSFPWITVFSPAKDRPILFTAAAWSNVLLTLDRRDFADLLGRQFYALPILKPGDFLRRERELGRWTRAVT
jgi:hypothetical protein